jgi:hypothetical protein
MAPSCLCRLRCWSHGKSRCGEPSSPYEVTQHVKQGGSAAGGDPTVPDRPPAAGKGWGRSASRRGIPGLSRLGGSAGAVRLSRGPRRAACLTESFARIQPPREERETRVESLLVATKLRVPAPRSGLIGRARLIERLERGAGSRLVLVSAPAGFGKTSLLTQWLEAVSGRGRTRPVGTA